MIFSLLINKRSGGAFCAFRNISRATFVALLTFSSFMTWIGNIHER
ncbi:hypothetical protein LTSESEN_0689 [Salmonella enterica subsp. enterica serovar Senftenberg str. A4-543]|uniref:Uncharacterized protein n=1 Tax=Salmonella enterica subsp. enterica serovar Senftenberg str. A4-543 TaxID=913082 RepID=G5QVL6_SALSE|nr:hypothetical protein LTSESEN_0689 [Salmonella enterica subsp. enterica serovar Senftenberg str. A4-543]